MLHHRRGRGGEGGLQNLPGPLGLITEDDSKLESKHFILIYLLVYVYLLFPLLSLQSCMYCLISLSGIFTAAFDDQIEWLVVKGITDYADGTERVSENWSPFASVMAASVVANILSDPVVFQGWPHYKGNHGHCSNLCSVF